MGFLPLLGCAVLRAAHQLLHLTPEMLAVVG